MPWTPRTQHISSAAATTRASAPPALCSVSGTSWPQLEGSLRTWRCWWVCGGGRVLGGLGEGPGPQAGGAVLCCVQGGAMGVHVHWNCDLDSRGSDCWPHYSFQLQERTYNFRCGPHCPPAPSQVLVCLSSCGGQGRPPLPELWMPAVCGRGAQGKEEVVSAPRPPTQVPSSLPPEPYPLHPAPPAAAGTPTPAPPPPSCLQHLPPLHRGLSFLLFP